MSRLFFFDEVDERMGESNAFKDLVVVSGVAFAWSSLGVVELVHSVEDKVGLIALRHESIAHHLLAEVAFFVELLSQRFGQPPGAETNHLELAEMLRVPYSLLVEALAQRFHVLSRVLHDDAAPFARHSPFVVARPLADRKADLECVRHDILEIIGEAVARVLCLRDMHVVPIFVRIDGRQDGRELGLRPFAWRHVALMGQAAIRRACARSTRRRAVEAATRSRSELGPVAA